MEACHDDKLGNRPSRTYSHLSHVFFYQGGGHFGRDKTLQKICSRFNWQDMTNDVKEHVRTCDTCQRTNKKLIKASAAELHVHPIPVRAPSMVPSWYRYRQTIDADTQQKQVGIIYAFFKKMVLAPYYTDYFSKWPEAQALPSKCAEGGPKIVLSLITRFCCFKVCMSDQGR